MKKSFYFALALTAGLFASCSSDDLSQAPQQGLVVNDNDAAQIQINVGNPAKYTRGTGSVTGTEWGGQDFNLFMFSKGTFTPATYLSGGVPTNIYFNTVMTTTPGTSIANEVLPGDVINYQYFPANGRFDFWAYRADDAADVDAVSGDPIVKYTDATGADAAVDEAVQVRIPFTLDGSQDLMIAETKTADAATELAATGSVNIDDAPSYIYSAYAARRGVNPKMTFRHQLTRLQFQVKAATRDVSTAADEKLDPATAVDANGNPYFAGFKVTKVEVWSKNQGELIAAYKGDAPAQRIAWNAAQEWTARDANDAWLTTTTLVPLELKSRDSQIEKAQIVMIEVNSALAAPNAYVESLVPAGYHLTLAAFGDADVCYTSAALDANTGELIPANETNFADARAAGNNVWIPAVKDGTHGDAASTPWDLSIIKDNASAQLIPLQEVIPGWEGYDANAGWSLLTKTATSFTWTPIGNDAAGEAVAAAAPYNLTVAQINDLKNAPKATAPTTATEGALNAVYCYFNAGVYQYYGLTAIAYNTDAAVAYVGASNPVDDHAGAPAVGEEIVSVDDGAGNLTYYKYKAAGAAVEEGHAVATPIGESMMVAPADENGYLVRFTYERCVVLKNDGTFEKREGEAIINVKVKATANAGTEYEGKFAPAKVYTVTAILYSDGEIKYENGDIEAEGNGTGDLDDNGAGYGLEN